VGTKTVSALSAKSRAAAKEQANELANAPAATTPAPSTPATPAPGWQPPTLPAV
jgi:hypothetical protein